jgi:putative ABC transport system permease protein
MKKHPLSDLDAEIRDHIEREIQDNLDGGMSADEARWAALRTFGNVTLAQENARSVWHPVWLDQLQQDTRYGLRVLRRNPVLSCAVIVTLALGIGLTTAVFSIINVVLLRPLPYADGDRMVLVYETLRDSRRGNASAGHFHDWTADNTVFASTAAARGVTVNLSVGDAPERVSGMRVTAGYFRVADIPPLLGRYFTPEEAESGERVVVLSQGLWERRFGADPSIVGRDIPLNGESFLVIGIAPAAYALTDPARTGVVGGFSAQLWAPLMFTPEQRSNYGSHTLLVLAKLKAGVSRAQAQIDLERVTSGIAQRNPRGMEARSVNVESLRDVLVGSVQPQLFILLAFVACVLLIGCSNIAGLLLARATTRRREIAIRASLGGGRARIVRQLLTESLILALVGGVAGLVVARYGIDFLVAGAPASVPRLSAAGLQPEVLVFALIITIVSAGLFGLAPAVRAARSDLQSSLRDGESLRGVSRDRLRSLLVVAEVAATVVLLVGAGLLYRSARALQEVPLGFDAANTVTARVALPAARYREPDAVSNAYGRVLEQLRALNGVSRVGASTNVPLLGGTGVDASFTIEGRTFPEGALPSPQVRLVTDGYVEAVGMTIVRGRSFASADMQKGAASVVVINERLAATVWPGEDPVGKRLSGWTAGPVPEWREVVGVIADVRTSGRATPPQPEIFLPYTHAPTGSWDTFQRSMVLVVRPSEEWAELYIARMRTALRTVDPSAALYDIRTMDSANLGSDAARRFSMQLLSLLALTGLGLATMGLFGVVNYFVTQRTAEIGLRLALGAKRRDVVRMVVGHGLWLSLSGIVIGLGAALWLTRVITSLLYEVKPTDPQTFVAVAVLVVVTILLASWVPAARAARVDPLVALRAE